MKNLTPEQLCELADNADSRFRHRVRYFEGSALGLNPRHFRGYQILRRGRGSRKGRSHVLMEGAIDLRTGAVINLDASPCDTTGKPRR